MLAVHAQQLGQALSAPKRRDCSGFARRTHSDTQAAKFADTAIGRKLLPRLVQAASSGLSYASLGALRNVGGRLRSSQQASVVAYLKQTV